MTHEVATGKCNRHASLDYIATIVEDISLLLNHFWSYLMISLDLFPSLTCCKSVF
jgi:hypothetical protein